MEFLLFSHSVPSQLILKYACTLDVLIHHIFFTYFAYTFPVLQNFEIKIWVQKTWMKLSQEFDTNCFLKVLNNCEGTEKRKS